MFKKIILRLYLCQNAIKTNGFGAQCFKCTEIGYSSWVTSSQIREHLYTKFPDLKEYKEYTVSFMEIKRIF